MNPDVREPFDEVSTDAAHGDRHGDRAALDPAVLVAGAAQRRRTHRMWSGAAVVVAVGVLVTGVQLMKDPVDGVPPATSPPAEPRGAAGTLEPVDPDRVVEPDGQWSAVDAARLPDDVPVLPGRVLTVEEHGPTGRLSAVVEADAGRRTAEEARQTLLDAGYRLTDESTDDERPFWWFGVFTSDRWRVVVDVSNETGGGFLAQYVLERLG